MREGGDPQVERSEKKRLWIVSELYYPEDTSTGFHMTQLAEGLAEFFDVNVLCGQPTYAHRGTIAPKFERHNRVNIIRARGLTLNKDVVPFRLLNMATLGLSVFFHAVRRLSKGETLLVVTTPPTMPFIVALAAKIRRAKYAVLVFDNYPETLVAAEKLGPDSVVVRALNLANRWLYKHAYKVIAIGRDMKKLIEEKAGGTGAPVELIALWADLDTIKPVPRDQNALLRELGIENKFVLLYSGNMGTTHDIRTIYECAERLRDDSEIHFLFAGEGAKRKWLERELAGKHLPNVTLVDRHPRERLTTLLNACDVALISVVDGMRGVSVPSRITNIMAAGKPVLAMTDPASEIALIIDEEGIGRHVLPGNSDDFLAAIYDIRGRTNELADMSQRARTAAVERYRLEDRIGKYAEVLGSSGTSQFLQESFTKQSEILKD